MDKQFEESVLAAIIGQPQLLRTYRGVLREHHFEHTPLQYVAKLVLDQDGAEPPNRAEVMHLIHTAGDSQEWGAGVKTTVLATAESVFACRPSSVSVNYISQFIIDSELRLISDDISSLSPEKRAKKLPEFKAKLEALMIDHVSEALTLGRNFFAEGPDGLEKTMEVMGRLYDPRYCIPTKWRLFDQIMLGGFRPKEVNVVMGPTNTGKSEFLIALARVFNAQGKRVVWYGLDSNEEEMSERIPVSQTGVAIDANRAIKDRQQEILETAKRHNLFIYREWSPNTHRVSDIRHHLQVVRDTLGPIDEAEGREDPGEAQGLIIDSPELMLPGGKRSGEAHRFDLKTIYYELCALCKEENKIGIASHQANRAAMDAISVSLSNVGEALAVVQPVPTVIGLPTRRIAERANKTRRVQFLKLRKPEGVGKEIRFRVDARTQMMWEDPDQEEPKDMWEPGGDSNYMDDAQSEEGDKKPKYAPKKPKLDVDTPELPPRIYPEEKLGKEDWLLMSDRPPPLISDRLPKPPPPKQKLRGVGNPDG